MQEAFVQGFLQFVANRNSGGKHLYIDSEDIDFIDVCLADNKWLITLILRYHWASVLMFVIKCLGNHRFRSVGKSSIVTYTAIAQD